MKSIGQFTKALERRVFRPLFKRSSDRMKIRVQALDERLASAEQHLTSAEQRLASTEQRLCSHDERISSLDRGSTQHDERISSLHRGWTQHIPSFLNAVSSVGAFGFDLAKLRQDHSSDINNIWTRLEFIRREILYELRYSPRTSDTVHPRPQPKCVSADKLAQHLSSGAKLNVGCGHLPLSDYINIDKRELPGVDIVAYADDLPFEAGIVHEIFSSHLVEHFTEEELRRRVLPHWYSLMKSGGVFRAIAPDGRAMLDEFAAGRYVFADFREALFGSQDYDGDFHYNLLAPDTLSEMLHNAGFRQVEVPYRARRNGKCFEFEIHAIKP